MQKKQLFVFVVGLVFASQLSAMDLSKRVEFNNEEMVRFLIRTGLDANAKDEQGTPLLHRVAANDQKEIARLLVEGDADVDATDKDGKTVLDIIVNPEIIRVIKETKTILDTIRYMERKNLTTFSPDSTC